MLADLSDDHISNSNQLTTLITIDVNFKCFIVIKFVVFTEMPLKYFSSVKLLAPSQHSARGDDKRH